MNVLEELLKDPLLFWTALAAISQFVTACLFLLSLRAIVPQLKQFRVEGLTVALNLLKENKQFDQVAEEVLSGRAIHGVDWDNLVEQISLVALLVTEGFTNDKLLFIHKGKQLSAISNFLNSDQLSPDKVQKLRTDYPSAFILLEKVQEWQAGQVR